MSQHDVENPNQYHRAKQWEIAFFALNNVGVNVYLFTFTFLTYYSTGVAGFTTLIAANLLGFTRLFDGLIDPTIGIIIDKFSSRFGKYRPIMVAANISLILSFLILFNTHAFDGVMKMVVYVFALLFHKIAYSFQQTVVKAAQPVLTNDPKQRPVISIYDTLFSSIGVYTLGQFIVSNFLAPRHGGDFNLAFFRELTTAVMVISVIVTILAVIGISRKDKPEYYGSLEVEETDSNVFKEIWQVIKGNRPLQILALSGAIMKFLAQLVGDQAFLVILFGIALGNFGLSGQLGLISVIPNFLLIAALTRIASTKGMKRSYMVSVSLFITFSVILGGILFFSADTTQIFANGWGLTAILFTAAWVGFRTFITYPNSVILTMSADITDYELDRSGKYSSGLVGTVFSFVESISSSMVPVLIGFLVALIGYTDVYPVATEALTPNLFNIALVLLVGFPVVFGLIVLFLIKIYPLDSEAMAQVQASLAEKRAARDAELAE